MPKKQGQNLSPLFGKLYKIILHISYNLLNCIHISKTSAGEFAPSGVKNENEVVKCIGS